MDKLEIYTDELTNLKNRRFLFDKFEEIKNNWQNFTFILFDLDNFKLINDTFGHKKGDEFLKEVGAALHRVFNEYKEKYLIRYAGDEFCIIIRIKDKESIKSICKKLLSEFSLITGKITQEEKDIRVGASIGISFYPENGENLDVLFEKADAALYYGKRKGKNVFYFFEEIEKEIEKEKILREKSTPPFVVNREGEKEEIKKFLNKEKNLHFYGEEGIGKTRLLKFTLKEIEKRGEKYLFLNLREELKEIPFGTFSEVLGISSEDIYDFLTRKLKENFSYLIIDNTEYMDEYSFSFIKELSKEFNGILSAGIEKSKWESTNIVLQPFDKQGIKNYILSLFSEMELKDNFLNWITRVSGGIPYKIEEAIRFAIERNIISITQGKFHIRELKEKIPLSIEEIYLYRIKALDEELRRFIISISVLGNSFDVNTASMYLGINPGRLFELLIKAEKHHIIFPVSRNVYSFISEHFRKFIYNKLSDKAKITLHSRIINSVSKLKDIPEEVILGTLAFHSKLSGREKEALEYTSKISSLAKKLYERKDIKELLEKRKKTKVKEIPPVSVPDENLLEEITEIIRVWWGLIESYKIYPDTSKIVRKNKERFLNLLNQLLEKRKALTISIVEDSLVADGSSLPNQKLHGIQKIKELFKEYEIQSISFVRGIEKEEIENLLKIFSYSSSDIKNMGGIEKTPENDLLYNIVINQKVYVALGEEIEALKETQIDTDKLIKELFDTIKKMPERSEEWLKKLNNTIRKLKDEEITSLFYSFPEDERVLKFLSKIESKDAYRIRKILEKEIEEKDKEKDVESVLKIRKIIKNLPEREKIIKKEKERLKNCNPEELLKPENIEILVELKGEFDKMEIKNIILNLLSNIKDPSPSVRGRTLEVLENFEEYLENIFDYTCKNLKQEKEKEVIERFLKVFKKVILNKIKEGKYEELQNVMEIAVNSEKEELVNELLEELSKKYLKELNLNKKDELFMLRGLFRITEKFSIPFLINKVNENPRFCNLLKEILKEKVKSEQEFVKKEIKKELPLEARKLFISIFLEEDIKIEKEIVYSLLKEKDKEVFYMAIELGIKNNVSYSFDKIKEFLKKGNEEEKIFAIRITGKYKLESFVPELLKIIEKRGKFASEPPLNIAKEAVLALSNFSHREEVCEKLIEALKSEGALSGKKNKPIEIRALILRVLKDFPPSYKRKEEIKKLLKEKDITIKTGAKMLLKKWENA